MSGPSSVGNTSMGVKDLLEIRGSLVNELSELNDLTDLLESHNLILLVAIDS